MSGSETPATTGNFDYFQVNTLSPDITDTTPPIGTISINNGAAYTNSTSINLTLSATDTGGGMGTGAEMRFSNDNVTWSAPEPYVTTKTWTLSTVDGTKTVYVKFKDAAGNWSTAVFDTIILDSTPPNDVVGFAALAGDKQVTLSWTNPNDADFAGAMIRYRTDTYPVDHKDGALVCDRPATFGTEDSFIHAGLQNGITYYYSVFTYDGVSNYSATARASATPQPPGPPPDATPPGGSISINNGAGYTTTASVTLTLSATDSGSGMGQGAQMQFSNDNTTWSTPEPYATTKSWTLSAGDGPKTVYARFKDAAGNWMTTPVSATIVLDATPPARPTGVNAAPGN